MGKAVQLFSGLLQDQYSGSARYTKFRMNPCFHSTTARHSLVLCYLGFQLPGTNQSNGLAHRAQCITLVSLTLKEVTPWSEERPSHLLFHALLFSLGLHL